MNHTCGPPSGTSASSTTQNPNRSYMISRLLMTMGDGRGIIWNIDPEFWKRRAGTVAGRALTKAEWNESLPGRPYEPACKSSAG
jgi:hypothetical protein